MTMTREQVAALLDGTTPGPWEWAVNRQFKTVELSGKGGDLTVISFVRWGMGSAAPVFWFWKGNVSDEPKRADALAVPAPGRDHHKHWFARIDHPDARLTAAAPDLARQLLAAMDRLADADMAQAALVERAAEAGAAIAERTRPDGFPEEASNAYHSGAMDVVDAIRDLAPDAGVQALSALRAERDRIDQWRETAIVERDTYSEERDDALRQLADAEADRDALAAKLAEVEAQVAALRELRNFLGGTGPLEGVWFGDEHPSKRGRFWWREYLSKIDDLTAALAAASLTPAEQQLFDASMAMREAAGQIAKEQME